MRSDAKNGDVNEQILKDRVCEFDSIEGPRVGDYVRLDDGSLARIAKITDHYFQLGVGSFYLHGRDGCSFSGTLYPPHPHRCLKATPGTKDGLIWFFSANEAKANNGVDYEIELRIFDVQEEYRKEVKASFGK